MIKDANGNWMDSPVHAAFGLTYASYYVMPRMVLEVMPLEWQTRFVQLMDELHDTVEYSEPNYNVIARNERGRIESDPLRNYRYPDMKLLMWKKKPTWLLTPVDDAPEAGSDTK